MERTGSPAASSTVIEFGPEFAKKKTPEEFVAAVNQYLQQHNSDKVREFHLFFCMLDQFLPDTEDWIAFALSRSGLEVLDLDLSMGFEYSYGDELPDEWKSLKCPATLFECKTLTHLSLCHVDILPPPMFSCFGCLQSLSLKRVRITNNILEKLIASLPSLEFLNLNTIRDLDSIVVTSPSLKRLTIVNSMWEAGDIEITAPELQSFIYYGVHIFGEIRNYDTRTPFNDISSLSDAFISSINMESSMDWHDFIRVVFDLRQVRVLTVCTSTLMRFFFYKDEGLELKFLPMSLQNLKELQLLVETMSSFELTCIYNFFKLCQVPNLDKLFIQLPEKPEDPNKVCTLIKAWEEPPDVKFDHLKAIKLTKFKGCKSEMRLVKFLLEKAIVLESLVLVLSPKPEVIGHMDIDQHESVANATSKEMKEDMTSITAKVTLLPKSSEGVNIVICEYQDDDKSLTPTHTEYFCEF